MDLLESTNKNLKNVDLFFKILFILTLIFSFNIIKNKPKCNCYKEDINGNSQIYNNISE